MKLAHLTEILEKIAPLKLAEPWDNVGLLAGDPAASVSRVLLTIDYTSAVAAEAKRTNSDLIIAYHPPIFEPLKRLVAGQPVFDAIHSGIAIYSPHTALDSAAGGANDMLGDVLAMIDRAPLRPALPLASEYKLVTFVPASHVEIVSQALFTAGAGRIGNYSSCSFRSDGTGTFLGEAGANPAVGKRGRLEKTPELRLETVVPISRVSEVITALRQSHPYEEPAFDLNQIAAAPAGLGMGRIGSIVPASRQAIVARIKRGLKISRLLVSGPTTGNVKKVAVCAGSCGKMIHDAIAAKADLFLTGEVRHHDALAAAAAGMTVVCALHGNSERPVLGRIKSKLKSLAPTLTVSISRADRDPFLIL